MGYGGDLVVPPIEPDPDLDLLLDDGTLQEAPAKSLELDGDCHAQVANLWLDSDIDAVGTGYALSDGLWRQHSWGVGCDGAIWETKWAHEQYLGVTLPPGESTVRFVLNNYAGDIRKVLRQGSARAREIAAVLRASRERRTESGPRNE
ncbi:MAG TPA: hypothetical protein VJ914_24475 [Pseudonocardiaceae bacterium]|nr:hypothetical protein [Pseudonocardiaceae bacterium]